MSSTSVRVTNVPAIKNAPLIGLAEGNGQFNNLHFAALMLTVPYILKMFLPIINRGGFKTYIFLGLLTGVPTAVGYWTIMSIYGARRNEKVALPGKNIEEYITIHDEELKKLYHGKEKIPMQIFHDAYFDKKIDIKGEFPVQISFLCSDVHRLRYWILIHPFSGDVLDILEQRHDFAKFNFTFELFRYVFVDFLPEVITHSKSQDEEQVRDHYDRELAH